MKPGFSCLNLATLILLAGCQGLNQNPGIPALIVQPDEASRAALKNTLSEIFGGQEKTIADDALTHSSILSLEINLRKQADSQPALGRVVTPPFRFQLVKDKNGCFLVDLRDGKRHLLENTTCTAE
jgi:hypothetical protein